MVHLKIVAGGLIALTLCLLLWPTGRALLERLLRAVLWATCLMTAGTAIVILVDAKEKGLVAIVGGILLLAFSAYAALTAKSLGNK